MHYIAAVRDDGGFLLDIILPQEYNSVMKEEMADDAKALPWFFAHN